MDIARKFINEEYAMEAEDDKYYIVAGMQFERGRKYTLDDYDELIPAEARIELIDGVFYEMYPEIDGYRGFPSTRHQEILGELYRRIANHIVDNNGPCKVFLAGLGVYEDRKEGGIYVIPDISVICDKDKLSEGGCEGAPDWIIEIISPSNPKNDYIRKLNLYLKMGVREYWIVDPIKDQISVYNFAESGAWPTHYSFKDTIKVGIYDDLYIDFSTI